MGTWMSKLHSGSLVIVLTGLLTGCAGPGRGLASWWHGNNRTETFTAQAASAAPAVSTSGTSDTDALKAQADEAYKDAKAQAEYEQQNPGTSGSCSSGSCSSGSSSSGSGGCRSCNR